MRSEFILALVLVVASIWGYRRVEGWRRRRAMARMRAAGREGEDRAERWLRANGFRIAANQSRRTCTVRVDGTPTSFEVRADFVVEDPRGQPAVVEVKTGASADPTSSATRRQIFEYAAVYGVKDVYLFDGSRERLLHLEFADRPARIAGESAGSRLACGAIGFAAGAALAAWFL